METVKLSKVYQDIQDELVRAEVHGGIFHSAHEAHGVIAEELDEFWDIVRQKKESRDPDDIRKELIQLAAMAVKAIHSIENFVVRAEVTPSVQACLEESRSATWGLHDQ